MRPLHPGEILRKEFLLPLELSANVLAMALRVPAPRVNDLKIAEATNGEKIVREVMPAERTAA